MLAKVQMMRETIKVLANGREYLSVSALCSLSVFTDDDRAIIYALSVVSGCDVEGDRLIRVM